MHSTECKPNEKMIGHYNKMFEFLISAGAAEKLPGWDKPRAKKKKNKKTEQRQIKKELGKIKMNC